MPDKPPARRRKPGRPTKFTPTNRKRILDAVTAGAYREQAALAAGISVTTLYEWIADGDRDTQAKRATAKAEFAEAIARADAQAEVMAIASLRRAMQDRRGSDGAVISGDWRAAEAFLRARAPERWSQHRDVTKLMERRLELDERMQESLALRFEQAISAGVALGLVLSAEQRAAMVGTYVDGLGELEGPDAPQLPSGA
jgi:hypothetical protein